MLDLGQVRAWHPDTHAFCMSGLRDGWMMSENLDGDNVGKAPCLHPVIGQTHETLPLGRSGWSGMCRPSRAAAAVAKDDGRRERGHTEHVQYTSVGQEVARDRKSALGCLVVVSFATVYLFRSPTNPSPEFEGGRYFLVPLIQLDPCVITQCFQTKQSLLFSRQVLVWMAGSSRQGLTFLHLWKHRTPCIEMCRPLPSPGVSSM
ncbi:hypothetical protein B0J18DRAFT_432142 [Chaetomium sp. MPI-SDFR-AT-0129]|nr:hypothetical protein B0J18DRAFT_432142 [Chaetomium sp. MPI-SDFR-AT-0129]